MFDTTSSGAPASTLYSASVTSRRIALPCLPSIRATPSRRQLSAGLKRAFDIGLALVVLLILCWAFAAIAAAVALTSSGPIFFRQRRTGLNGETFTIYKFRTMTVVEDGDAVAHARKDDARVTRIGATLRQTSLDELPQLINILKGDMSFVGPRPHALAHDRYYGSLVPRYADRFRVRPGLTGLAQVCGFRGEIHSIDCMVQRVDADVEYAKHWSFREDLKIILWTIPMVLRRTNAY